MDLQMIWTYNQFRGIMDTTSFTAKSALIDYQLKAIENLGVKFIEVQLLGNYTKLEKLQVLYNSNIIPVNVHATLTSAYDDWDTVFLNALTESKSSKQVLKFFNACEVAQQLATHYNRNITLVLHNGLSYLNWRSISCLRRELVHTFEYVLKHYPDITFAIENVTPMCREGAMPEDAPYICDYLNKELNTNRFQLCIDTCHVNITADYIKRCCTPSIVGYSRNVILADYIRQARLFGVDINTIHLNYSIDNGDTDETHSTGFTVNDKAKADFMEWYNLLQECCPDAKLVLELKETNYKTYSVLEENLKFFESL